MPPRYLQCQQPFWTRSTCTWWTPIRPIWILPFLDVSKSGYLKRNDVSLSLIFYPRKIPFLKRIFGDNVWLSRYFGVSKTFFQNSTNLSKLWNSFTMYLLLHINFQVYFLSRIRKEPSERKFTILRLSATNDVSILSQRFLIRSREPVAKSQLKSWRVYQMDGKRWRRGFRLDISQAMRWRGGSMQRGWKLLGRGDDAYDVDNDHGRDHHLDQKGNQIQIERDYPSTVSRYRSDVFKIVFEIEKRYGSTSNRDKLLTLYLPLSLILFSQVEKTKMSRI